jgi:hypothetical protein
MKLSLLTMAFITCAFSIAHAGKIITITGPAAKAMYNAMTEVGALPLPAQEMTFKTGNAVSCAAYDNGTYECRLAVNPDGSVVDVNSANK